MMDLIAYTWMTPYGVLTASPFITDPADTHEQASGANTRAGYGGRMASKSAKLNVLATVPLLSGCSKRELSHVAKVSRPIDVEAGTIIADQGQTGSEAFIILEGEVAVRRNGRRIASLGSGDVVGELSLLDHGPRTASVVCDTDAKLLVLSQHDFRDVIEHHPSIAYKLLGTLAERIREFDRKYYGWVVGSAGPVMTSPPRIGAAAPGRLVASARRPWQRGLRCPGRR